MGLLCCASTLEILITSGRVLLPFHVKLRLEGLPHHAWYQEIAEKVVGEEAVINHVDQASRRRTDLRYYVCLTFCSNPSRLPQVVYVTLSGWFGNPALDAQLHFSRPRTMKHGQVFRILVHVDSVEDLMFYHHPPEQL
jgi:hypothetical protein